MGLREGFRELWDDMFSYRTLKVVKISDKRLAYVHKSLMALILVYAGVSMIGGHTYMLLETPGMYISTDVSDTKRMLDFNQAASTYCNKTITDYAGDPPFMDSFHDNICKNFSTSEIVSVSANSIFVGTHVKETNFQRECNTSTDLCSTLPQYDTSKNYFATNPENVTFQFKTTLDTSWFTSAPSLIYIKDNQTNTILTVDSESAVVSERYPSFSVDELLELAGVKLDDRNELVVRTDSFVPPFPLYRLTGIRLSIDWTFSNFRPMSSLQPFDYRILADVSVSSSSKGYLVNTVETVHFSGEPDDVTSSGTILEFRGVEIEFRSNGLLGKADFYTTMMALMSCFIMVSVATTVVDIIGAFIYDSFKNDKIEDDGERQHLEHMILNLETVGVPFNHDDLQVLPNVSIKEFLQLLQRDIVKLNSLALHISRDLTEAGFNRHASSKKSFSDAGTNKQVRYKCYLIGPDKSEIYLTGGPQTIGRGNGNCISKRISHKQLSILANTYNGTAILRGLHTKNMSGIAISGGAWQPISGNDEVELEDGDMIALLLDEKNQETSVEGVFVYRSESLVGKKAKSGWLDWVL
ncbi:predicted protein [Bathycoccus prasinos]|jgi:hypothetical protein|uniref:FHA domain-containing protein n=1 Tax=Bathycoccus prasinos TaxID=41875 RepID=K8F4P1_9CHLO|nr:predicted protein [Bathycoccus prasinos]CCO19785.1 predicted protein [Bathycoccus prasinos]|mmetsp:Transcript_5525/g.17457  ORF Transcript_5525/g.17457 Transcript_5525/m.17457 type:complete len:581 (+) Transcript_5525:173-1915(+)|eukprot:XP_007509328.1 predicted protein [Bathycoccus prasinos]